MELSLKYMPTDSSTIDTISFPEAAFLLVSTKDARPLGSTVYRLGSGIINVEMLTNRNLIDY